MRKGKMVGEVHCHTNLSKPGMVHKALPTPFDVVDRAIAVGLDFLVITDHDTQEAFPIVNEYALSKGLVVIPGVEVSTRPSRVLRRRSHILAIGVPEKIESFKEIKETIDAIHAQNGLAVAAHPFCSKFAKTLFLGHQIGDYDFDGIEVFNSTELAEDNAKALAMAKVLDKLCFAGSDAHGLMNIGRARLTVEIPKTKRWQDIVHALGQGAFSITSRDTSLYTARQLIFGMLWRKYQPESMQ